MSLHGRIIRRLAALSEPLQRVAVLAEEADRLGPEAFAKLLSNIVIEAGGALAATIAYLASDRLDDESRLALLAAARDGDHQELLQLLVSPAPHRVEEERRVPDYGAGRILTLGERKSLARRPNRHILERVMTDPHPEVIRNLLRNPKLTEADVIRLVTRRPNRDDVLAEVYGSSRWVQRYTIKVALVRNPYTPPAVSLKLLPLLLRQDLVEVSRSSELHPSVLLAARRLLSGVDAVEGTERDDDEPEPTIH
jgi:hypothetical protein